MRRQPVNGLMGIVSRLLLAFDLLKISACTSLTGNGIDHAHSVTLLFRDEQKLVLKIANSLFT